MRESHLYSSEVAVLVCGTVVLVGGVLSFTWRPPAQIDSLEVIGEGAIAVAFLVVVSSIYRFRASLDAEVYHPFVIGFTSLYFSATLDFLDEFVLVTKPFTYAIENAGGVLGAIFLAVAFGYWVNQYEERGQTLTEQEEKLHHRNEQLEVLNRIVRHDIRNDLNIIDGRVQLARDHVDPEGQDHLEKAHRATVNAITLTDTARDFVNAVKEDERRELEPIPLQGVLKAQIERTRQSYPDAQIRLATASRLDVRVQADDMISSLFRNLLVNAVQHNDKPDPSVTVSIEEKDDTVLVSVADNGPGIPEGVKNGLFERGEMGLESTDTGIGLYLVDRLVAQYGGDIRITDNEPDGTVFRIELQKC